MNAIILAAGKSSRFAPFTYEKPKGLFKVKGEILIERQIEQMIEAGIDHIYIVVGYMKEKFFYLERKYEEVELIINNQFGMKGNLYSLFVARQHLANAFISYADYYFTSNPFTTQNADNRSYHVCIPKENKFKMFSLVCSDASVITRVDLGGCNQMAMVGPAYLNEGFAHKMVDFMESEIDEFRVSSLFWEEYFHRHISELTLYALPMKACEVMEFNSIDDLRQFDSDFLYNVDSGIITNICHTLNINANDITDINVINAGLTNVSFRFKCGGTEYVYRHPGGTAGNLIDRSAEIYTQNKAFETGIDKSVIAIKPEGWKLSYCVQDLVECDFRKHPEQLRKGMQYLRTLHSLPLQEDAGVKVFDNFEEAMKLIAIASKTKGNLFEEFAYEIERARLLDQKLKTNRERLGIGLCYCHNDTYEPNFLATADGDLYLIDWEYAGINDPANDLACFFSRYDYTDGEIDMFISLYLAENDTPAMHSHFREFIPLAAFYWMAWGLYKGSVGDDDGFFFLPAYRNFHRFINERC